MDAMLRIAVGFAVLQVIFLALQLRWPAVRGQRVRRAGWGTDLLYLVITPLVVKPVNQVLMIVPLLPVLVLLGVSAGGGYQGHGLVAALPGWVQAAGMVVIGDFVGYWIHRWFHTGPLWRFHAVHHSSTELDWLSSVRVHPVNDLVARTIQALVLLILGFNPTLLAAYLPFLTFYPILLHANLSWDFGLLRRVLASPTYHRWHHADAAEAVDHNFAGLLPCWDWLFGTLYLPADRCPRTFGVRGVTLPTSFAGLMLYPFRPTHPTVQLSPI